MDGIDKKITQIINHFHLNNFSFSKRIGVTGTTIDSIVNGRPQPDGTRKKTKPGYDVLKIIIDTFNINPDFLFGKSPIMLKDNLPKHQTYSEIPKVVTTDNQGKENVIYVPVKARAGYLEGYGDPEYIEALSSFHMPYLTNGTYRCFEVSGNSMAHTFFDGDLVFGKYVEHIDDIKNDKVYVIVSTNDGVVLKRITNRIEHLKKLVLSSDNHNGNYPDYTINIEDICELWEVIMYTSKQIPQPFDIYDKINTLEHKINTIASTIDHKSTN